MNSAEDTLMGMLLQRWREDAAQIALVIQHAGQPDRLLTRHDLLTAASAYARALDAVGIRRGEVVVLILQHGIDLVAAFFGAMLHGAVPSIMPFLTEKLLPERYRADLATLVNITRPAAIVTYGDFEQEVHTALTSGGPVRAVLVSERIPMAQSFDPSGWGGQRAGADDIALLQHSSGTTGLQKGVALAHRSVINQLRHYAQAIELAPADVVVSWLPLYHDMGLIAGFILPLLAGVRLVLMSPFDWVRAPQRLLQAVSNYHGTVSWLPNFAYNFCAQKVRQRHLEGVELSSWRMVINCSEPARAASHRQFYDRFAPYGLRQSALAVSYAMAENVFAVTQTPPGVAPLIEYIDRDHLQRAGVAMPVLNERPALEMVSCGPPIAGTQVRSLDPAGRPLPERQEGELAVRSDCMLAGYYNRPDATAEVLRDGWYLTGDYGYLAGGEVFVTGRKKDVIITGGRNIYPQDIELLAGEVAGVHPGRVVAFGVFDEAAGTEEVVLVAEVDAGGEELMRIGEEIRRYVSQGSAVALRQVHLVARGWLVKTSSGKIARGANREKWMGEVTQLPAN
ncbi:MAG: AMP-binding protein [Anaerolineaceae bacterium]|jgi:acyl-CoA synthetase (AMP-forming)/AMP-acid ligase II